MSLRPVRARERDKGKSQGAPLSSDTQKLLQKMMAKSRLTPAQKRKLNTSLQTTGTLPKDLHGSGKVVRKPTRISREIKGRVPLPARPTIRTSESILATDPYAVDKFVPKPAKYSCEEEKARLADVFEDVGRPVHEKKYGAQGRKNAATRKRAEARARARAAAAARAPPPDRFADVLAEIEERKAFLEEMTALGARKDYEAIIHFQIAQKIEELKDIDAKRAAAAEAKFGSGWL
ncbi:UPF0193 protein EVG1 [Thecamonas trahens ATCC 50062]|uniref:UPF0193 protein EVG1 n=1 Tax=Thecamonas trahens ATCC 50062 TaxID=461836 RepID=A0A0L0D8B6_THETB|nr:UPF0193 protein EVG1 [Thecamonas trahens ATCC 50062]KNC48564.1 UPF0193 protein EVG1 [Thecamonas trahens ATCC 50062]|eukprot:XP_013762620.1 UPF0193 protein EVG1 [Thecamonas trahens ATCC 50062]